MKLTEFAVLTFDCYGTLVDWECGILGVLRPWARCHHFEADDETLLGAFAEAESRIEREWPALLYPQVLRRVQVETADRFKVAGGEDDPDLLAASIRVWPPFPDTPEALAYFKRHFKIAVVSNADNRSFAFTKRKLGVEFDLVVSAEDIGSYKPDPGHFERALTRLEGMGIPRHKVLHAAQSLYHDIAPASALGLKTVWADRRRGTGATPPCEAAPDMRIGSLAKLAARHRNEAAS